MGRADSGMSTEYEPWRHAGLYRHTLCTNSVFEQGDTKFLIGSRTINWKPEPKYLEAFAHLAHSPGRFCLGPQEDPNHLRSAQTHSRYGRRQRGCVSDIFMDNPVCGLQAALCVVSDPRSLLVHGIFDRVPFPGSLVRRPTIMKLPKLEHRRLRRLEITLPRLLRSIQKVNYYTLQHSMDLESLMLVDSWCAESLRFDSPSNNVSMENFLANVPPPGTGRHSLSARTTNVFGDDELNCVEFDDDNTILHSREHLDDEHGLRRQRNIAIRALGQVHVRPGPRLLSLLWVLSAQLGWAVDDNQGVASVFVDRRILIGAQYLSISLMAGPLFWTLVARYFSWIPAAPLEYRLQALPVKVENEMR